MNYTTIKIPVETHRKIKSLAKKTNLPQQDLLAATLRDFEEKLFWDKCDEAYSKNDRDEDDQLYENTLMDGIEDEY